MSVPFSDDELSLVAAEFSAEYAFWSDSLNLEILLGVAHGCGVLSDLRIAQLLAAVDGTPVLDIKS